MKNSEKEALLTLAALLDIWAYRYEMDDERISVIGRDKPVSNGKRGKVAVAVEMKYDVPTILYPVFREDGRYGMGISQNGIYRGMMPRAPELWRAVFGEEMEDGGKEEGKGRAV